MSTGGPFGPVFGGGGYFGNYGRGPQGPWMGCGCTSILMILVGILLVFMGCAGGCSNMLFRQYY
jgi:hypothetical protein